MSRQPLYIKKEAQKLKQKIAQIVKDYDKLDDAKYILQNNEMVIRAALDEYVSKLGKIVTDFFTGAPVDKLVTRARREFYRELKKYDYYKNQKRSLTGAKNLLRAAKQNNAEQVSGMINEIKDRTLLKILRFKDETETLLLPLAKFNDEVGHVPNILIKRPDGYYAVDRRSAEKTWNKMQKIYGDRDKVLYRKSTSDPFQPRFIGDRNQGKLYPMRSYVDAKVITVSREVDNLTTIYEGQANGIYTGQINRTGTDDSCILWEKKTIFLSEEAKEAFMAQYGDKIPAAKTWLTYNEVKQDKTHMFSFGCKHRVKQLPLQLFLDDLDESQIQKSPNIPESNKAIEKKTQQAVEAAA